MFCEANLRSFHIYSRPKTTAFSLNCRTKRQLFENDRVDKDT